MSKEPEFIFRVAIVLLILSGRSSATELIYASHGGAENTYQLNKYDLSGASLGGFRIPPVGLIATDAVGNVAAANSGGSIVFRYNAVGKGLNIYEPNAGGLPFGSAFGPDGNFYLSVNNQPNSRIERFAPDGTWLGVFCNTPTAAFEMSFDDSGNLIVGGGGFSKFDPNGMVLDTSNFPKNFVWDFAFDNQRNLYVVPGFGSTTVLVYSPLGTLIKTITAGMSATSVAFDKNGLLYVGGESPGPSPSHAQIRRFSKDGTALGILVDLPRFNSNNYVADISIVDVVPEPASCTYCIVAVFGLFMSRRRRLQK